MTEVVITAAKRTPVGSFLGAFAATPAHELGRIAIEAALEQAGVKGEEVSEVILGQVLTAAQGQNPARQASMAAGVPKEVPAWGLNQVCGSGLRAVALAAQAVQTGDATIVVDASTRSGPMSLRRVLDGELIVPAGSRAAQDLPREPSCGPRGDRPDAPERPAALVVDGEVGYLRDSIAFVAPETLAAGKSAAFLPQLRRAIIERKTIRFHYHTRYAQDGRDAKNTRDANPYALLHYGDAWYLIGHCHLRRDIRNFRLDRLSDLRLLDKTFDRPPNFRLEPPEDDQRHLKIVALFSPEAAPWVRESRSYYIDSMEEVADGLMVTMRVRVEDEIFQWLFSWGSQVRVLEPESLRRRLAVEAGKILENYSG